MSPSASSSLIGRASPELLSDWSRQRGGGGEAFSRVEQRPRGLAAWSGRERAVALLEWGGEWEREGVEGGCRRAHTVS